LLIIVTAIQLWLLRCQPVTAVLGKLDQEPRVPVWRSQNAHRRLVSFSSGSDLHGQLFTARTTTGQGVIAATFDPALIRFYF